MVIPGGGSDGSIQVEGLTPGDYVALSGGKFDGTTRDDLAAALAGIDDDRRLVVHFHGGLVDEAAGIAGAERLRPIYREAGAHPLFVVWRSGLLEVVGANLAGIADEPLFKRLVARLLQFTLAKGEESEEEDGARGLALELSAPPDLPAVVDVDGEPFAGAPEPSEPLTDLQESQVEDELEQDLRLEEEMGAIAASLQEPGEAGEKERGVGSVGPATTTHLSPEALAELNLALEKQGAGAQTRGLISTAWLVKTGVMTLKRVVGRLARGRGHGIYPTVVEEVLRGLYLASAGGVVWSQMKQDTADAFGPDPETYGGTALLQELAKLPSKPNPVLVGHSAGAIYICNLLRHSAPLPPDRRFDVVLLAPACDFELLAETLAAHDDRIERLRIFCMKDDVECRDKMVPLLYPRSLLYFVSGILEDEADAPIVGMQRFHLDGGPPAAGKSSDVDRVRDFLREPGRAVWSVAGDGDGLSSSATTHGGFDDDEGTLKSVQHFIRQS